jgi:hypothetical protein
MDIYEICKKGDVEALAKLLDADPALIDCQTGTQKWTPLYQSLSCRQAKVTEFLIAKGANVNLRTAYEIVQHCKKPLLISMSKRFVYCLMQERRSMLKTVLRAERHL